MFLINQILVNSNVNSCFSLIPFHFLIIILILILILKWINRDVKSGETIFQECCKFIHNFILTSAWCLRNETVHCVLLGATSVDQLYENIQAIQVSLKNFQNLSHFSFFTMHILILNLLKLQILKCKFSCNFWNAN